MKTKEEGTLKERQLKPVGEDIPSQPQHAPPLAFWVLVIFMASFSRRIVSAYHYFTSAICIQETENI